jgi:DNA-binding NtrC family response regulator
MKRILVIDDDRQMRLMLEAMLKSAGYEVRVIEDGVLAQAAVREFKPDLVVTDLFMPEKEGLQTITELRREAPKLKLMAISGGTPLSSMDFLAVAKKMGAHKTLAKPFARQDMLTAVAELIGAAGD